MHGTDVLPAATNPSGALNKSSRICGAELGLICLHGSSIGRAVETNLR